MKEELHFIVRNEKRENQIILNMWENYAVFLGRIFLYTKKSGCLFNSPVPISEII
jgi:hypothetical protein